MRTGQVAFIGTAKPCCDIAKDLHLRDPPRILQQAKKVVVVNQLYSYRFRPQASEPGGGFLFTQ